MRSHKAYNFESADGHRDKPITMGYAEDSSRDITFYIDLEMLGVTDIQKVVVPVAADCKVSEAVIIALEKFNTELVSHGIELPLTIDLYAPRLPKKNGRPKLDLPSLDYKQKMFDTKVAVVSIQIKDK
jgi:hypothetical protein